MNKNNKFDKPTAKFDYDFVRQKFDGDGVEPPQALGEESVKNALAEDEVKNIPFVKSKAFKTAVSLAACFALIITCAHFSLGSGENRITENSAEPPVSSAAAVETFENIGELKRYAKELQSDSNYKYYDVDKSAATAETATVTSQNYARTYTQVSGVDEADIIKNDGKYIYAVSSANDKIIIYQPNGKTLKKAAQITIKADESRYEYISGIYVRGKYLVALTDYYDGGEVTESYVYDLTDISSPKLLYSFSQEGTQISSRMIDGRLYLVNYKYLDASGYDKDSDYLPAVGTNGKSEKLDISDVCYIKGAKESGYLLISEIDVAQGAKSAKSKAILGSGSVIYCNKSNMYVANNYYDNSNKSTSSKTLILKVSLDGGIDFTAKATVNGTLNNQYSMDENDEYLRVATTVQKDGDISNALYVLDSELKTVGKVTGFAKNESIQAVRFVGDTAYVITYLNTDPLFVIDLGDPKNPSITGEVKISGFSTSLTPIDESALLGIGYAADDSLTTGIKLALFDVSDPDKPKVLDSKEFKNINSDAQYDPKAIVINASDEYFAVPYVGSEANESGATACGVIIFEVKSGKINVIKKTAENSAEYPSYFRCTYIGENIYTFSDGIYSSTVEMN